MEHLNTQIMNNRHYTTIEEKVNQTKDMQLIISTLADIFMVIFSILVFSKILKLREGHIFIRKCLRTSIMFSIILLGFVAMNILLSTSLDNIRRCNLGVCFIMVTFTFEIFSCRCLSSHNHVTGLVIFNKYNLPF